MPIWLADTHSALLLFLVVTAADLFRHRNVSFVSFQSHLLGLQGTNMYQSRLTSSLLAWEGTDMCESFHEVSWRYTCSRQKVWHVTLKLLFRGIYLFVVCHTASLTPHPRAQTLLGTSSNDSFALGQIDQQSVVNTFCPNTRKRKTVLTYLQSISKIFLHIVPRIIIVVEHLLLLYSLSTLCQAKGLRGAPQTSFLEQRKYAERESPLDIPPYSKETRYPAISPACRRGIALKLVRKEMQRSRWDINLGHFPCLSTGFMFVCRRVHTR